LRTPSIGATALVLGAFLMAWGTACELVVGTNDRKLVEDDAASRDTGADSTTVEDASVGDDVGADADVQDDSAITEEQPITYFGDAACDPPIGCYSEATSCANACHDRSLMCQSACGSAGCRQQCRHDEIDCKAVCETACGTCTMAVGCYDPDGCAALTL
jgi:hypothetical protein